MKTTKGTAIDISDMVKSGAALNDITYDEVEVGNSDFESIKKYLTGENELTLSGQLVENELTGKVFDEIINQDGGREITLSFDSPEFRQQMEWYAQGFELWKEFIDMADRDELYDYFEFCYFCGEEKHEHAPDCIYLRARKMLKEAGLIE